MELLRWLRIQWDRALAGTGFVLGVLMLLIGWVKVSGTPFVANQMAYIVSAGFGGLVAVGIGGVLWISADLRDEWRKLDRLEQLLVAEHDRGDEPSAALAALAERVDQLEARGDRDRGILSARPGRNGRGTSDVPAATEGAL